MLSQDLDELEKVNLIEDMDNYLDGFCFKFDQTILPKKTPNAVRIEVSPELNQITTSGTNHRPQTSQLNQQPSEPAFSVSDNSNLDTFLSVSDNAIDYNDLDYYTMQFFQ